MSYLKLKICCYPKSCSGQAGKICLKNAITSHVMQAMDDGPISRRLDYSSF